MFLSFLANRPWHGSAFGVWEAARHWAGLRSGWQLPRAGGGLRVPLAPPSLVCFINWATLLWSAFIQELLSVQLGKQTGLKVVSKRTSNRSHREAGAALAGARNRSQGRAQGPCPPVQVCPLGLICNAAQDGSRPGAWPTQAGDQTSSSSSSAFFPSPSLLALSGLGGLSQGWESEGSDFAWRGHQGSRAALTPLLQWMVAPPQARKTEVPRARSLPFPTPPLSPLQRPKEPWPCSDPRICLSPRPLSWFWASLCQAHLSF